MGLQNGGPSTLDFNNTEIAFKSRSNADLRKAQILFMAMGNTALATAGPKLVTLALRARLPITPLIKLTLFDQFCGGETIAGCERTVEQLARFSIGAILDYSVEGEATEKGFDASRDEVLRLIDNAARDKRVPFAVFKVTSIARVGLLAKVQAGKPLSAAERDEWTRATARFDELCDEAGRRGVRVLVDAEDSWTQDPIDALAFAAMQRHNRGRALIYNTVQLYRHDRLAYLRALHARAKAEGLTLGVKLVRGAYLERERAHAKAANKPGVVQPDKAATDRDFDAALGFCVANVATLHFCAGSHNESSNRLLVDLIRKAGLAPRDPRIEFAQLLGMSDHLSFNLAHAGFNVSKYVPYGPVRTALPYLFRRAEENSSIQGQTGRELTLIERELRRRSGRS